MPSESEKMKTAVVTGASSGIGKATCELLIAQHYRVIAVARNQDKLLQLTELLGENCLPVVLDLTDAGGFESFVSRLPDEFQNIDVLINNAGHDVGGRRRFDQGSVDQWCDIIATNVQGLMRITHAIIPGMLERGVGHIVNLGSTAGLKPYATGTAYVASKYAVHGLSETLRLDYAGCGIRVSEIMPGLVRTDFASQRLGDQTEADQFYDGFDQCLHPENIADTILYALQQPAHVEIAQLVVLPVSKPAPV